MNSSYVVETSYSVDGKLKIILIVVAVIILAAIIVSLLKLIKTGKIKIGKEKNTLNSEDNLIEETETTDSIDTLDNDNSVEELNTDNLNDDFSGYETPNFNDISSVPNMQEQVMPQMNTAPNMQEQVMPQMNAAPNMQEQVMPQMNAAPSMQEQVIPQMNAAPSMQEQVMPQMENSSDSTNINQLDNFANENETPKSIWSNNSDNNLQ